MLLLLACCSRDFKGAPVPYGKTQAPVSIAAHVEGDEALVTVTFLAPGSAATVSANGLVLSSGGMFVEGQSVSFTTPARGETLAVEVSARFYDGPVRGRAVGFELQKRKRAPALEKRTAAGERVHVMPATPMVQ